MAFSGAVTSKQKLGKDLYTSGKIWNDFNSFIKDFPELKPALAILAGYNTVGVQPPLAAAVQEITGNLFRPTEYSLSIPSGMQVYLDMIKNAAGRDMPITVTKFPPKQIAVNQSYHINEFDNFLLNDPVYQSLKPSLDALPNSLYYQYVHVSDLQLYPFDQLELKYEFLPFQRYSYQDPKFLRNNYYNPGTPTEHMMALITAFIGDIFKTPPIVHTGADALLTPVYSLLLKSVPENYNKTALAMIAIARGHKQWIMNCIFKYLVTNFEAQTSPTLIHFNEVYGIKDIAQVPPRTISYVVTDTPPPASITNWGKVDPWSALFSSPFGLKLLDAIASNFPVGVHMPADWKDTGVIDKFIQETKDYKLTEIYIQYVWNDFYIEIDRKQSILVKYIFKPDIYRYTHLQLKERDTAFMDILMGVAFLITAMIGMAAIGAALAAGAAGAAGAVTGVSLTIPTTTLGLTGLTPLVGYAPVMGMATGVSTVGGMAAGATLASFSGAALAADMILTPASVAALSSQGVTLTSILSVAKPISNIGSKLFSTVTSFEKQDIAQQQAMQAGQVITSAPQPFVEFSPEEFAQMTPVEQQIYQEYAAKASSSTAKNYIPILALVGIGLAMFMGKKRS